MTKVNPYLNFAGNAEEAFNFYKSVFGGEFCNAVRFKDFPMEGVSVPKEDDNKMMHISLPIGDDPTSKEEADRIFNALAQGGDVEMAIADQAWGDYYGALKDKFGVQWKVNYSPPREQ